LAGTKKNPNVYRISKFLSAAAAASDTEDDDINADGCCSPAATKRHQTLTTAAIMEPTNSRQVDVIIKDVEESHQGDND
jgi:hypothetical protein